MTYPHNNPFPPNYEVPESLIGAIEERRQDESFMGRLRRRMKRDRAILDRLADDA